MERSSLFGLCLIAATLPGCGDKRVILPPAPPHGGTGFALSDGKGFVEALRQSPPGQPGRTILVVYFLGAERKPLANAPTTATFLPRTRRAVALPLRPIVAGDPSTAGGLATEAFDDPGEIVGTLSTTIEDRPVTLAIGLR